MRGSRQDRNFPDEPYAFLSINISGIGAYLKVTGWGWFCLSAILDAYSRYIIVRKLCTMMKNCVLLENYYLPGDLERQIGAIFDHYTNRRDHKSRDNLTPADVYLGRGDNILKMREEIPKQTIRNRRLQHQAAAAKTQTETKPEPPL